MTKLSRKIKQTLDSSWSYSAPDTSPLWRALWWKFGQKALLLLVGFYYRRDILLDRGNH
jgi:hypothetical protein